MVAGLLQSGVSDAFAAGEPPYTLPAKQDILSIRSAVIQTEKGDLLVQLYPESAPWHVANFKYLADKKFYNNLRFHIHEPRYVIQTGAPGARINSGPGYTLPPEFNEHSHRFGALSMVRKPNDLDTERTRRSHGSQFRIMLRDEPKLDKLFTVFGQVVDGFDVLQQLTRGDRIIGVTVFVRNQNGPPVHKYADPPRIPYPPPSAYPPPYPPSEYLPPAHDYYPPPGYDSYPYGQNAYAPYPR